MFSLKIKLICSSDSATRDSALAVLNEFNVRCSKIDKINDELMLLYCNTHQDVDRVFSSECIKKLKNIGYTPHEPPYLQANRSIIVKRLDKCIYDMPVDRMKIELESANNWMQVKTIYKFPNSKTIKITLIDQDMAQRAQSRGLFMFQLVVPATDISIEEYINMMVCYKCYEWDNHLASKCPKDDSYMICSLCSSTQHIFKNCESDIRLCVNCGGNHSTLSYACPVRKVKAKSFMSKNSNTNPVPSPNTVNPNKLYSHAVSSNNNILSGVDVGDKIVKASMCIMISSLMNHQVRSDYEKYLGSLLQMNDLPLIKLGNIKLPVTNLSNDLVIKKPDGDLCMNLGDYSKMNVVNSDIQDDVLLENSDVSTSSDSENVSTDNKVVSKNKLKSSKKRNKENLASKKNNAPKGKLLTASNHESPVAAAISKFSKLKYQTISKSVPHPNDQKYMLRKKEDH